MLSKKSKAIGFIIMSAFGFAMMAAFVRLAGDLPFTQKTFFRNLVAVAVAAVVLCREKVGFKWEKGNLPLLIIRATCGTLGIFCNYYAIDHLVLADANILNKMSPFFAIIFSAVLGFFLFGQLPDGWSVLGYLLICGISVAVFFYNRNLERKGQ